MSTYLSLMRPVRGVVAAGAVYVGAVIAGAALIPSDVYSPVFYAMFCVFLIVGGGLAINDSVDASKDAGNKPKRPIPSGQIGRKKASVFGSLLIVAGNIIAFLFLPEKAFYALAIGSAMFVIYNLKIKDIAVAGHVVISILIGLSFIFGGIIMGNYGNIIPLALVLFVFNVGREIYKTTSEVLSDKSLDSRSVAVRLGVHNAKVIGSALILAGILITFGIYLLHIYNEIYLFFIGIADIAFIAGTLIPVRYSPNVLRIAIILTAVAFLFGAYSVRFGF